MNFDVEDFYPPILIDLFKDAISYVKTIKDTDDDQLSIIIQSRKTLLFNKNERWVIKSGKENFDVLMGCYDGTENCELVRTYILNKLKNVTEKENIGLYRDDGLGKFKIYPKLKYKERKRKLLKCSKIVV